VTYITVCWFYPCLSVFYWTLAQFVCCFYCIRAYNVCVSDEREPRCLVLHDVVCSTLLRRVRDASTEGWICLRIQVYSVSKTSL